MAYKLNSFQKNVYVPGDPTHQAYFRIRFGGKAAEARRQELIAAELDAMTQALSAKDKVAAKKAPLTEADIPPMRSIELTTRALLGTWIIGWGGWEDEAGHAMESVPGALDEAQFLALMGDRMVNNWIYGTHDAQGMPVYVGVLNSFGSDLTEAFEAAEGNSGPQPAGNGAGEQVTAN